MTGKDVLDKLEQFRSVTASDPDSADPKQEVTNDAINDMLDPEIALGNFVIDELPLGTTRAGLYIHLSAMVCFFFFARERCVCLPTDPRF